MLWVRLILDMHDLVRGPYQTFDEAHDAAQGYLAAFKDETSLEGELLRAFGVRRVQAYITDGASWDEVKG